MRIKNIWKLIKITFLKSIFTQSSFIFNMICITKFFDVQTRFTFFSLAREVMKFFNNTHREKLALY